MERWGGGGNKTVWDVLVVVGALLVGAAAGFWFSEQRITGLQREDESVALHAYFEQMSQLLLEKNLLASADDGAMQNLKEEGLLDSEEESEVHQLARARTITAVADSGAEDNRSLTRFLANMDLVTTSDPVRLLRGAYLPNAELSGAFLPAADLYISKLGGADLSGAFLISANLGGSILSDADLEGANLRYADLDHTDLDGANLRDADLSHASLIGADLRGANLEGAQVTDEQLDACEFLQGATMPDGSKHP